MPADCWEVSVTQLSGLEQILWRQLAVFATRFTRDAIDAVAAGCDIPSEQVFPLLDKLIAHELVIAEPCDDERCYRLPDAVRLVAHAQLINHDEADDAYRSLVRYYASLAEQVLEEASGPQRATWMRRLEREYGNLRVVLDWLVGRGDAERGLQLAFLLQELWFEDVHTGEGRLWFAKLLALPPLSRHTALRAQALDLAGALALHQDDYATASVLKEEAIALLRELGDIARLGYVLNHHAYVVGFAQGDLRQAQALYQEALGYFQTLANADGTAHTLANMGTAAILQNEYAAARLLVAESLQMYRSLGYTYNVALSLSRAAGIAAGTQQPERALRLAGASAAHCATIGVSQSRIFEEVRARLLEPARQLVSAERQTVLWEEGQAMTFEQAVMEALDVLGVAARSM